MAEVQTQSSLTDDEYTVLLIAKRDDSLLPIGRWQKPVMDLYARGFLRMTRPGNYGITDVGLQVLAGRESDDDRAFANVISQVPAAPSVQKDFRGDQEQAAHFLADWSKDIALVSNKPVTNICLQIYQRALELLQ